MDLYEESDHCSDYHSDEVDSETEVRLYGAIHHAMVPEDSEKMVTEVTDSGIDFIDRSLSVNSNEGQKSSHTKAINSKTKISSEKPLNNLFRLLDTKLDESDNEFYEDFDFDFSKDISQNKNKRKIDVIDIDDSSDDSDIVIIDSSDDEPIISKYKTRTAVKQNSLKNQENLKSIKQKSPKNKTKIDISLGNVNNLEKSSLEVMNEFYDEDNYNSEEESKSFNRMSGDRNLWRISNNDILLTQKKNNRYYRNRFICNNCSERGHQARDCPLPKKSPICPICGLNGHRSDRCRSVLCSRCLSGSHRTISCNVSVNQLVCDECGVGGHETNQCTYNWRKYHLTTTFSTEEPIIFDLRPNARKCCYNCGAIGKHFGFECRSKSMEKRMTPVSVLMPNSRNTRESHCFNGRQRNNRRNDCPEKALYNEFVKKISSNELSRSQCRRLSASFNKPLDRLDFVQSMPSTSSSSTVSATIASTFNNKNKHMKWIYPETNGTTHLIASSYSFSLNDSTPFIRNCQKNRVIADTADPTQQTILYANSTTALNSAHTLTPTQTHQQINNSMQEKTRTQTTPQLNERSKRRKNRRKKRKIDETEDQLIEHHSLKESNITEFRPNPNWRKIKSRSRKKALRANLL